MNKHKKFIKDAYEGKFGSMCQDWKDIILENYPEFKEEKFRVGDWVFEQEYGVFRLEESPLMTWQWTFSNADVNHVDHFNDGFIDRKATDKEVEEHLTKEAERMGYKNGNYKCLLRRGGTLSVSDNFFMDGYRLWHRKNGLANCVYKDGQWAEIIPTITKEEAEKKLNCKIV